MSKTKKQPVKQVKAAQGKQDAEPVEKTANESVKNEESKRESNKNRKYKDYVIDTGTYKFGEI